MAEARAKELQEELTATYKDKARVAEELVAAGRQLQIVRESNEAQARGPQCVPTGLFVGHGNVLKCPCCSDKQSMAGHALACGLELWSVCKSGVSQRRPALAKAWGAYVSARLMPVSARACVVAGDAQKCINEERGARKSVGDLDCLHYI